MYMNKTRGRLAPLLAVTVVLALLPLALPAFSADPIHRINAGGAALASGTWAADTNASPSGFSNQTETGSQSATTTEDQTPDESVPAGTNANLFKTHRWDPTGALEMQWDFPVANGGYEVRLYFSETAVTGPSERIFDVSLEGSVVLDDFDVFAEAGGQHIGIARSFIVEVSDDNIDINFAHVGTENDNPMISGIEIIPTEGVAPVSVDPGTLSLEADAGTTATGTVTVTNTAGTAGPNVWIESTTLTGSGSADFSDDFADNPVALAPGDSLDVTVSFDAPLAGGASSADLAISVAGAADLTVALTGTSTTEAPASLQPSVDALDLGSVQVGMSASGSVTLTNTGADVPITITAVTVEGLDAASFDAAVAETVIAPSDTTELEVTYTAAAEGGAEATVRIDHDGTNTPLSIGLSGDGFEVPPGTGFTDIGGSIFQTEINWLAASGITRGCNPPDNTLFCPTDHVTRGQMAAFLHRALEGVLTPGDITDFVDDNDSVFEADIEWLGATGVTKGCNPPVNDRFCPTDFVTRGQMAAFLHRALEGVLTPGDITDFVDDNDSVFEADIEWLGATGVTRGCNPPVNDRFCPDDHVTREQMAAFLYRALRG